MNKLMSNYRFSAALVFLFLYSSRANSQLLTLKDAVQTALNNYGSIKAKANYVRSAEATAKQTSLDYLPNLSVGAQQAYGTANGQFGPLFASGGLNAASSGPPFATQNWNAAFGALYVANINWDLFTFGRVRERIRLANADVVRQTRDLEQEKFQQQVRVAGAYLNLLAAQRLRQTQQKNLERANALRTVVVARAVNGLNAGVDSSLANAEVSSARIALTNAGDYVAEQTNQLVRLMGIPYRELFPDSSFFNRIPSGLEVPVQANDSIHPLLLYYQSRIDLSREQEKYYQRLKYPVVSMIGVIQGRASGFRNDYSEQHPHAFTHDYWSGVRPERSNYLLGLGVTWNLTSIPRVREQVLAQEWTSRGLQDEYELVNQQVKAELELADQKMKNAIANYKEAPVQVKAASDAYLQKSVLYKNGLTNIVEVNQSLYALNRAENDRDISINNLWQALLLAAAAKGDFNLFINQF
jgi:outer membrane protein TolC